MRAQLDVHAPEDKPNRRRAASQAGCAAARDHGGAEGAVEYIENRDLPNRLALTSTSCIEFLGTSLAALKRPKTTPFCLEGSVPPVEYEEAYYRGQEAQISEPALN
jgi:hypothetical protein